MTLNISGATRAIATRPSTVTPTMWTAEEIALREEHDGCPAMHGTGCVCETRRANAYVRLTLKSAHGLRESPTYVNRHQVLYVTPADDGISTKIFLGATFVLVAESLECVVEKLGCGF